LAVVCAGLSPAYGGVLVRVSLGAACVRLAAAWCCVELARASLAAACVVALACAGCGHCFPSPNRAGRLVERFEVL